MFVLIVTWFAFNQAPQTYQTDFNTPQACEAARRQVLAEEQRLVSESEKEATAPSREIGNGVTTGPTNSWPPPRATTICARR